LPNDAADLFGFVRGVGDGERGKDADGAIDDASGIRLKITGGDIGDRGDITYITGFGDQLKDILLNFLDNSSGTITNKLSALDQDITTVEEDRADLEARMDAQEARLKAKFLYKDSLIQTLNTTLDYVKQQFDALNGNNKD
jgi:flagellar hook-associated protein 2